MSRLFATLARTLAIGLCLAPVGATAQQFTLIPALETAWGVSNNGVVVGRTPQGQAARWESGSVVTIEPSSLTFEGWALGVSSDGSVVVGQAFGLGSSGQFEDLAFRWTATSGAVVLSEGNNDAALAVSGNGARTVGVIEDAGYDPDIAGAIWLNTTTPTLVHPDANSVSAISRNGRRAAGAGNRTGSGGLYSEVFRTNVNSGAVFWLGFAGTPMGTNRHAHIVGATGVYPALEEAFLWTPSGGLTLLGDLPGGVDRSQANALTLNAEVIVGFSMGAQGAEATIWTVARGLQTLEDDLLTVFGFSLPPGVTLLEATDITPDGKRITGHALDASGTRMGFLLEMP